jgi:hypothetical protein
LNITTIKSVVFLIENLEVAAEPVFLNVKEAGRYFDKFCRTHYLPNAAKQMEYPEDGAARLQFAACTSSV